MTRDVIALVPETPLVVAHRLMELRRIRHVPIVSGERLVGILSDRDVLRYGGQRLEGKTEELLGITCGEAMTLAPVTCSPDTSVGRAAQLMIEHKIDSLPVLDVEHRLVGLVTSSDLLLLLVDRPPTETLPFDYRIRVGPDHESVASA